MTTVTLDLAPLVNNVVVPLLTPVLMAAAGWALKKAADFAHFSLADGQRQVVETAIANGIAFAQARLGPLEHVGTPQSVQAVVDYVLPKIPGALRFLGVTPDHLSELVAARLAKA